MASFWKKISKTFLTLLLMLGVFFAGCVGLAPTQSAHATFNDQIYELIQKNDTIMWSAIGANDVLIGVDEQGYVYKYNIGGGQGLNKTGIQLGNISQGADGYNLVEGSRPGDMIAYKNQTFVVTGYDGTNTVIYYSTDNGNTWSTKNIGIAGKPKGIVVGNGYFVCSISNGTGNSAVLISSSDGINWSTIRSANPGYYIDSNLNYNSGYFMYTESCNPSESSENIIIYISSDLVNWTRILAPTQFATGSYFNIVPFYVNNALYCVKGQNVYKAGNISSNTVWQQIGTFNDYACKVTAYGTGVIVGHKRTATYYDIAGISISNSKDLVYTPDILGIKEQECFDATICTYGNNWLCVGFSGAKDIYYNRETDIDMTYLNFYRRALNYTVTFLDWNGNVIGSQLVAENECVVTPAYPSREGYIFAGWDYDLTQPITEDTVITALYEIKTYTVSFLDWNGQLISSIIKEHGSVLSEKDIPEPIRDNYSFVGWDKDISQSITNDITFNAQYSRDLTLTINYLAPHGTTGFVNQYVDMRQTTKVFNYTYGDAIATEELKNWYNDAIVPWQNDLSNDGVYDYRYKLTGWNKTIPTTITNNLIVNATYEELNLVTLKYYSQLRFLAYTEEDGTDYYYTFIGFMTIDKLMADGEVINLEKFQNPNVNYNIYNASKNTFYNNLEGFEFMGWDKDITAPVTDDVTISAQYKLPTIETRLFDADNYFIGTMQQQLSFMTIEDLQALEGASATWDKIREGFRLFFSLQWGDFGNVIADNIDLSNYLKSVKKYHAPDCQILTAFVCVNTDYPEYGGIFKNGLVATSSPVLEYYTGTANENNMSFWINPVVFATDLYKLTCTVTYSNVLTSAVKAVSTAVNFLWTIITEYWWVIVIVVLLIIFRKPIIAGLGMLGSAIKKSTSKMSAKIKSKSKNSQYKKTEREYTAVKKQSKRKEK